MKYLETKYLRCNFVPTGRAYNRESLPGVPVVTFAVSGQQPSLVPGVLVPLDLGHGDMVTW